MYVRPIAAVAAVTLLCCSSIAAAQSVSIPGFYTARALSFAGARSLASGAEAIFLNPAGLVGTNQYVLQLDYAHDTAPSDQLAAGDGLVISMLDGKTSPKFPVGVSYRYASLTVDGQKEQGSVYDAALGVQILQWLNVGIHLQYLSFTQGSDNVQNITGDVGLMVPIANVVTISAIGFNLIEVESPDAPRGFDTGISAGDTQHVFRAGFDFSRMWPYKEIPTNTYTVGFEIMIAQMVPIRAGLLWDQFIVKPQEPEFVTAGTGFYFKIIGVDVSYRRDLHTAESIWTFAAKLFM